MSFELFARFPCAFLHASLIFYPFILYSAVLRFLFFNSLLVFSFCVLFFSLCLNLLLLQPSLYPSIYNSPLIHPHFVTSCLLIFNVSFRSCNKNSVSLSFINYSTLIVTIHKKNLNNCTVYENVIIHNGCGMDVKIS